MKVCQQINEWALCDCGLHAVCFPREVFSICYLSAIRLNRIRLLLHLSKQKQNLRRRNFEGKGEKLKYKTLSVLKSQNDTQEKIYKKKVNVKKRGKR